MTYTPRHNTTRTNNKSDIYKAGLKEEVKVLKFLESQGYTVSASSHIEDCEQDIDAYVNGMAVSVKAMHKGKSYGDVYFELATQIWQPAKWTADQQCFMDSIWPEYLGDSMPYNYNPGWWFSSRAEYYLILQQTELCLFAKCDIEDYILETGFDKVLGLSGRIRATQGRNRNTVCGFVKRSKLNMIKQWHLA